MLYNSTGNSNNAIGNGALEQNTTGSFNVSTGWQSMRSNTTGTGNAAYGFWSLRDNTTGNNNTAVGNNAFMMGSDYSNSTAIGNYANITASNQVRIGNGSVTSIGGFATWSNLSDMRFKKDIREDVPGLSFILALRPVTFTIDMGSIDKFMNLPDSIIGKTDYSAVSSVRHTGFIAQEVEKVAEGLNFEFSGIDKPQTATDYYNLRYAEFTVPIVKAVQELSAANQAQQRELELLKSENEMLRQRLENLENLMLKSAK
jgi:trimeric autotransporter adhesin